MPATYKVAALLLRYLLAALGVLIVLKGANITYIDLRRAARIRKMENENSAVAVMTCLPADRQGKGMRLPLTRSGCVGCSGGADVTVKGCGLRARHFEYEIRRGMMEVTPLPGAKVNRLNGGGDTLLFRPGEKLLAGKGVFFFKLIRRAARPVSPEYRRVYTRKG